MGKEENFTSYKFRTFDKLNNNIFDNAKEIIKIDTPKKKCFRRI